MKAKQLLIYGGISLLIIIGGILVYSKRSRSQWTEAQTKLIQEGKIDQATGSFLSEDGVKHIEYQDKRYLLDGDFCMRSKLERFAVTVKRFNGAAGADGPDGNTMYAIGSEDNPEYIDTKNELGGEIKEGGFVKDCWRQESA